MSGAGAKVAVIQAVRAAIEFWKFSLPRTAGVLAIVALLTVMGYFSGKNASIFFRLLAGLASLMASGALLRLALADEHPADADFRPGPQGLQWGKAELNLLGAFLLLFLLMFLGVLALILIATLSSVTAVFASGAPVVHPGQPLPAAELAVGVAGLVLLLVALWVFVRVSLYPAATVARKQVQVFSTWALTKGQFWPILAAIVLLLLPTLPLSIVITYVPMSPPFATVALIVLAVLTAFVELPLLNGLYAHLYRALRQVEAPETGAASGPWSR